MKCPICKGTNILPGFYLEYHCDFCDGKTELDWVECIFGVEYNYELWYAPAGFKRSEKAFTGIKEIISIRKGN